MKFIWRAFYTLLLVLLIAGLVFLVTRARPIDPGRYNDIVGTLRDLKQLNADWDVDTLRTRTGDAGNYGQAAGPLPAIADLQGKLAQASQAYWGAAGDADAQQRLKPLEDQLTKAFADKADAVERYKSRNAVLRNSARFLPSAAVQLGQTAAGSSMTADNQAKLAAATNELLAAAMSFIQAPSDDLNGRLTKAIGDIGALTAGESPDVAQAGATLIAHANTVLAQQATVNQLLAQAVAQPVAKAIDDLADAEAGENQRVAALTQQHQLWLEIYAAALVALLLLLAWRLAAGFRALGRSNAGLERANREIRASQAQLIQSEKMASLGQMVAGIAHEINTPLAYVKGTFSVLKEQLGPFRQLADASRAFSLTMRAPQRDRRDLNKQFRAVERASQTVAEGNVLAEVDTLLADGIHGVEQISDIVLNLRNFSRLDREKVTSFSVEQGLDSTLLLARNLLKNMVDVRKDYGHVPNISGSPSQINQVFLNLVSNAVQAMPALGERPGPNVITLRTRMTADAKTVRVDIIDNGRGIPKDVLPKIFDPFFTTKPVGQGTGLGLTISYKIVAEHGGRILVDSKQGMGTTFSVLLPIDAVAPAHPPAAPAQPAPVAARPPAQPSGHGELTRNTTFSD